MHLLGKSNLCAFLRKEVYIADGDIVVILHITPSTGLETLFNVLFFLAYAAREMPLWNMRVDFPFVVS